MTVQRSYIELKKRDEQMQDTPYHGALDIGYTPDFEVKFSGWLTPNMISDTEVPGHISVATQIFHTREGHPCADLHPDKNPEDIWVSGKLEPTASQRFAIVYTALNAA